PHDPSAAHTASFSLVLLGSSGHFRLHPTSSGYLQYLVSHNIYDAGAFQQYCHFPDRLIRKSCTM
ncbi:MAG: hypothetical protein ACK5LJ_02315, partial [Paracoccus sp. (in: a-proteobacteria)]